MKTPKENRIQRSLGSRIFDVVNVVLLCLLALSTIYPFWDTLVVSMSSLKSYLSTNYHIWPSEWSFEGYAYMLNKPELWRSYGNTIFVTVAGTLINMVVTIMTSYVLSKPNLRGHRVLTFMAVFTMMFSGGIIPTYMVVKDVKLMNSLWALIIPTAISTYNMIILRNFMIGIPHELEESAMLDGCTEIGVLFRIVLP
ncbi:MAG: carbohydrate ABC transporter permease, partial [Clostridia bacterium]|nr:carbohydrate ABC transporter permease [Clostridia bacterium]